MTKYMWTQIDMAVILLPNIQELNGALGLWEHMKEKTIFQIAILYRKLHM